MAIKTRSALCTAVLALAAAPLIAQTAGKTEAARDITFSKDIAPVMQRACQNCHRPNNIAPMSLLTYKEVRPWARAIKEKVAERSMPPWFVDHNVGIKEFKDDPSLTSDEIKLIATWADSGAHEGNPADMPPPRHFDDSGRWHIGTPDLIVQSPVAFTVKAKATDWWGNLVAETGLTEDRYIKAVETKPSPNGGARVLHHSVQTMLDEEGNPDGGTLNEYAVGKNGDYFPDGSGKLMRAGSKLQFNVHYHSVGEEITDQVSQGVVFYPKGYVPKHVVRTVQVASTDLDIPAGEENARSDAYFKFEKATKVTGFMPHMHNRGKAECIEAIYPDMRVEPLNCVSKFNFGWQIVYNYTDDSAPILPAGTILHVINWHDNSTKNAGNPDARNWVGYGERTNDEMSKAWVNFYYMTDEEYKSEMDARKAKKRPLTSTR
ncbi:MAG: hypothetical protein QOJ99_3538 [Bryobacterales bacterium]|nr:hypothetical protein [Bryobacterales bacterium]